MLSRVTIILPPYQSGKWPARGAGGLTDYLNREQTSGLDLFFYLYPREEEVFTGLNTPVRSIVSDILTLYTGHGELGALTSECTASEWSHTIITSTTKQL